MNKLLIPIFAALLVAGCETATQQSSSEKPVKHAGRLKAALYDSSSRSATTQLDVYDSEQKFQRAHKIIALLTCEGAAQEEGEMVNAINYRARRIGASGVIVLSPDRPNAGLVIAHPLFQPADRRVFRAQAILYVDSEK